MTKQRGSVPYVKVLYFVESLRHLPQLLDTLQVTSEIHLASEENIVVLEQKWMISEYRRAGEDISGDDRHGTRGRHTFPCPLSSESSESMAKGRL